MDEVLDVFAGLKALGVRLALDDFGTGYSSLSHLSRFPVDILKIDRTFVEAMGTTRTGPAELVRTIVSLGRSLRMTTIAEGIERVDEFRAMAELGVDLGQGFYFGHPTEKPMAVEPRLVRPSAY